MVLMSMDWALQAIENAKGKKSKKDRIPVKGLIRA